jgi:hypothetical protein
MAEGKAGDLRDFPAWPAFRRDLVSLDETERHMVAQARLSFQVRRPQHRQAARTDSDLLQRFPFERRKRGLSRIDAAAGRMRKQA